MTGVLQSRHFLNYACHHWFLHIENGLMPKMMMIQKEMMSTTRLERVTILPPKIMQASPGEASIGRKLLV